MVKFFIDTATDMFIKEEDKLLINYIELPIYLDDEQIFVKDNINNDDFYLKFYADIKSGKKPKTSAINPQAFIEEWTPSLESGDDIIYLSISSGFSGTYNFACNARDELLLKFPERKILVIDSRYGTHPAGMIAERILDLIKKGESFELIEKEALLLRDSIVTFFVVESLSSLKRGGRISMLTAVVGSLLNIKPILTTNNAGKIVPFTKAIGYKKAFGIIGNLLTKHGPNAADFEINIGHANASAKAEELCAINQKVSGIKKQINILRASPVIGAHVGPGVVSVSFVGTKPKGV